MEGGSRADAATEVLFDGNRKKKRRAGCLRLWEVRIEEVECC